MRGGEDVQTTVRLSFLEAVSGCTKKINYEYFVREPISSGRSRGFQKVRKSKSVEVAIPAGVEDGLSMRVEGKGAEGAKGYPPGDLYVQLQVAEDKDRYFRRSGVDLTVELPISLVQAVLGGSAEVGLLS